MTHLKTRLAGLPKQQVNDAHEGAEKLHCEGTWSMPKNTGAVCINASVKKLTEQAHSKDRDIGKKGSNRRNKGAASAQSCTSDQIFSPSTPKRRLVMGVSCKQSAE